MSDVFPKIVCSYNAPTCEMEVDDVDSEIQRADGFNYDSDHASSIDASDYGSILEAYLDDSPAVSNRRLSRLFFSQSKRAGGLRCE